MGLSDDRQTVVVLGVADGESITAPYEYGSKMGLALLRSERVPGLIVQAAADAKAHLLRT